VPKFGKKVPHLRCNSHTSSRSIGQMSGLSCPLMLKTWCAVSYEWQGLRTSNLVYVWRTTTRISHRCHDLQGQRSRSQDHAISVSCVGPVAHKSKTNSRSITKICTWYSDKVPRRVRLTVAVTSKVKGQGHKLTSSVHFISASSLFGK